MEGTQVEQERNGALFDPAIFLEARDRTRALIADVAANIRPGMIEEDARERLRQSLKAAGMLRGWHGIRVSFGCNTARGFEDAHEPGVMLQSDDIFLIDIGPVWRGHEGDAGETFVVGDDPDMHRAARDVKAVFDATEACWRDAGLSGAALYRFAADEAARLGWTLNLDMSGHRLSDFPHAVRHDGALLDTGYAPGDGLWVLEVHIRHPERAIGAFYEDLLMQSRPGSADA